MTADKQRARGHLLRHDERRGLGQPNNGEDWTSLVSHLPEIYSLEAVEMGQDESVAFQPFALLHRRAMGGRGGGATVGDCWPTSIAGIPASGSA